jgi:hypothetical protein
MGHPTSEETAAGKRLGLVGQIAANREMNEKRFSRQDKILTIILVLLGGKAIVQAPVDIPVFLHWLTGLFGK